ncbi:hypothetical protein EPI10_022887 [Gossypium australe]|uniref:DNA/RNA polymerases superfamily protein n=1 Tax=Gossypium australe TaxID=47621 RepID=A0A5B6VTV5_9ROSI|nr:hypothetical protein EPI10_022887 [Gossypium australe]
MLQGCVIDFRGSWKDYLQLVEFTYNNSFQSSIQMAPYEAQYGCKCCTPLCWTELGVPESVFMKKGSALELPLKLARIHVVFHVSMLRWYRSNPSHIVPIKEIEIRPDLTFEQELVQILDRDFKVLRKKIVPLVKVTGGIMALRKPLGNLKI